MKKTEFITEHSTTGYDAPEIKIFKLHRLEVICSSIPGFGPGSMNEEDINPDDGAI